MDRIKRNWKKIALATLAVILIAVGILVGILLYERDLDQYREQMIGELKDKQGTYDERSIVLKNTSFGEAERLADKLNAQLRITDDGKFATLTLSEGQSILDVFVNEENKKELKSFTPDYEARISGDTININTQDGDSNGENQNEEGNEREPSSPLYSVYDALYENQTYLDYMNLQDIWSHTKGGGMTIAIIDTGVDTDHPDLMGKISEYSYNASLDKIVKDWTGENGGYDWSLIEDQVGHGTQVAGVIGANMDNIGITGIAPEVEIVVIKAECKPNGAFERTSDLVFGIYYAIECDVDVINMSFGTGLNYFSDATQLAYDSDVICVASAGNSATSVENYPAADQYVIGVGALEANGWELAEYSNYGNNTDVVAPGTVYTTKIGGGYTTVDGTSFASPLVAGAVSLYMSQYKYQTFDQVYEMLSVSGADLGDLGKDWYFGYGAVDVSAFILEERGSITFEMLTDEVDDIEGTFIRNHTMQELPMPERLYSIFDGWYYDDKCTEEYVYYEDVFTSDLTLYAKWINESDGIPYTYEILDDGTVEITSYTGHRKYISVPDKIEGRIVSSIGEGAFYGERDIREIKLPTQLRSINANAFKECSSLLSIQIPDTVTQIGDGAFLGCVRMSSVELSNNSGLTQIGSYAFASCGRLQAFELTPMVTSVNATAFYGDIMLTQINVMKGNNSFASNDGVLFNRYATELVAYPAGKAGDYTIPASVMTVKDFAFACCSASYVDFANVTSIGKSAFTGSYIETLVLKDTVKHVDTMAFSNCSALSEVHIGAGLTMISDGLFDGCMCLKTVTIPKQVQSIGENAFRVCGIEQIVFEKGSSLRYIGNSAFIRTALTSIEIPKSVNLIDSQAFKECYFLGEVTFENGSMLNTINSEAFSKASIESIELPQSLRVIGEFAFSASKLTGEIAIHENITQIGNGAFSHCYSLEKIEVAQNNPVYRDIDGVLYSKDYTKICAYPAGNMLNSYEIDSRVSSILPYSFAGTYNLVTVTIPPQLTVVGEYAFYECGAESYTLNQVLVEISDSAFAQNVRLLSFPLPSTVKTISREAFKGDLRLVEITFPSDSQLVRIGYGAFSKSGIVSITVPASVSSMGQNVFSGCSRLSSVTFAENSLLKAVPAYMFNGATALKQVIFEEGSALTSLQAHAFEGMTEIEKIDLAGTRLTTIDNFALRFCESLTEFNLPSTVTYIGRYAFYGCTGLSSISLPSSMEYLGPYAFLGTDNIELYFMSESFPPYLQEDWDKGIKSYHLGVVSVEEKDGWKYAILVDGGISVISYTGNETEIDLTADIFGGSVVSIGGHAFEFGKIEKITLPSTLTSIQAYAFADSALTEISIPESVTFIGQNAFSSTPIKTLTFEGNSSVKTIEQYAFAYTSSLAGVEIPASVDTLGTGVFTNSGITELTFGTGIALEKIPALAFAGTGIKSLTLPSSVSLVDDNAFRETKALRTVDFGENEYIRLMSNAFYLSGLTELTIPDNVGYIGEFCFVGLNELAEFKVSDSHPYYTAIDGLLYEKDGRKLVAAPGGKGGVISLPSTLEEIGFGAFEYSSAEGIVFHEDSNILTFGYRAFFGMENLREIVIPKSVVSIDYYAFAYCTSLERVVFEEGSRLSGIYEGAFCGDELLYDITLPNDVLEIADYAFFGCSSLKKLPIAEGSRLKGIYSYAFAYTGITELNLPVSVIDIGEYAFKGSSLESVYIPDDNYETLIIGFGAFDACNSLKEITLPFIGNSYYYSKGTYLAYIFGAPTPGTGIYFVPQSLEVVTLSDKVTVLTPYAFYQLINLKRVNLPSSVTTVYDYAFGLTSIEYEFLSPVYVATPNDNWIGNGISGNADLSGRLLIARFSNCKGLTSVTLPDTVHEIDFSGCSSLESITVPSAVTSIGNNCFRDCAVLREANLHKNITSIGDYAFSGCKKLKAVNGLENLSSLGEGAFWYCHSLERLDNLGTVTEFKECTFYQCESLKSLDFPSTLTAIGESALWECHSLREIKLPDGLISIEGSAFAHCDSFTELTIPGSLTNVGRYAFSSCSAIMKVTVEEGVTSLDVGAFYSCTSLREIELPSTLTSIGDYAFEQDKSLSIIRNNSSIAITMGALDNGGIAQYADTVYDKNGNVTYKDSMSVCEYVQTADGFKFAKDADGYKLIEYLGNEETVTLPNTIEGSTYTLDGVIGVRNVIIPSSFTEINDYAFCECTTLESVEIKGEITRIGNSAFSGCSNLKNITLPKSLTEIGDSAFNLSGLTSIEIGEAVTSVGERAFDGCYDLVQVRILAKLEKIEPFTFYRCGITEITIPSTVKEIGDYAFFDTKLTEVVVPEGVVFLSGFANCAELKAIKLPSTLNSYVDLSGCTSLTRVVLPDRLTTMPNLSGCTSLTYIYIGKSVSGVGPDSLRNCTSLSEIEISKENVNFSSENGIIYIGKSLVYAAATVNGVIKIKEGINQINSSVFEGNTGITQVICPSSMKTISDSAFKNCTGLEKINLNAGTISQNAFEGCTSLKEIDFTGVKTINQFAFRNCTALESIVIPSSVTAIKYSAFNGCKALTDVTLSEGLTEIGDYAFSSTSIREITVPSSVTKLSYGVFASCGSLEKATLHNGIKEIPSNTFAYCYKLRTVKLPDSITKIGGNAFVSNYSLVKIEIPEGVTKIEDAAFSRTALTEVTLPSTLTSIGNDAFKSDEKIYLINNNSSISLTIGGTDNGRIAENAKAIRNKDGSYQYAEGVSDYTHIDTENGLRFAYSNSEYALVGYVGNDLDTVVELPTSYNGRDYEVLSLSGFVRVKLPSTMTEIPDKGFEQNYTLVEVVIPEGVTRIGEWAFYYTTALESVYIPSTVTEICDYAFYGCRSMKNVTIENGVTSIGWLSFADNNKLQSIVIPDSVKVIDGYAFDGCEMLEHVTLGPNLEEIGSDAFRGTELHNNKEYWTGEALFIGNYLIDITPSCELFPYFDGIKIISKSVSFHLSTLKQAVILNEVASLRSYSNADTIIFMKTPENKTLVELFGNSIPERVKNIVILDAGVPMSNPNFFNKATGITIYLGKTEKELRWDANYPGWSNGNRVYYEDEWICAQFYNDDVLVQRSYLTTSQVVVRPHIYDTFDETSVYGLIGWDLDGDGIKDRVPVTSTADITARAVFGEKERRYTITFLDKNGDELAVYSLPYGQEITPPQPPTQKGYSFVSWDGYYDGITVNGDMSFSAVMLHDGSGHVYSDGVYTEPSCTQGGGYKYICTVCGEEYLNQIQGALGHVPTQTVVPPTCTSKGYTLYHCVNCEDVNIQHSFVPTKEHNYGEWKITLEPTCTEGGSKERYCSDCGLRDVENIRSAGHEYDVFVTEPSSCVKAGTAIYTCSDCNDSHEAETSLTYHSYELKTASYEFISGLLELMPNMFVGRSGDEAFYYECNGCGDVSTQDTGSVQTNSAGGFGSCSHVAGNWQAVKYAQDGENGILGKYCIFCSTLVEAKIFSAVEITEKGVDYVKYKVIDGYEYSIDGINYSTSGTFSGLIYGNEYIIYVRDKETKEDMGPTRLLTARKYTYTFYDYDGSLLKQETMLEGETIVAPVAPSRNSDAQYTYTFAGYEGYTEGMTLSSDISFKAVYSCVLNKYTYTFYDEDGVTELKKVTADYGTVILPPEVAPTKQGDVENTYTFGGYEGFNDGMLLTGNVSFKAMFTVGKQEYTYTFYNYNGEIFAQVTAPYGSVITLPSIAPQKPSDVQYSYTFIGYEGYTEGMTLTGEISFTAMFENVVRSYTYTFIDLNGGIVSSGSMSYGGVVIAPPVPQNPSYPSDRYDGVWQGYYDGYVIKQDVEFTISYVEKGKMYSCHFADWNGRIIYSYIAAEGSLITLPEVDPQRNSTTSYTYTFIGYEGYTEGMLLTENKIFIAKYEEKIRMYSYEFLDWDGSVIASGELPYGASIPKPQNDPVRENDGDTIYTFNGYTGYYETMVINTDLTFTATYIATQGSAFGLYTKECYGAPGQIIMVEFYTSQATNGGIIEIYIDDEYVTVVDLYLNAPGLSTRNRPNYMMISAENELGADTKVVTLALSISENAPIGTLNVFSGKAGANCSFASIELSLLGDVDQNGTIDQEDIGLLNRYALGEFELSEREQYFADVFKTDVYEPGSHINAKDVLRLRQLINAQASALSTQGEAKLPQASALSTQGEANLPQVNDITYTRDSACDEESSTVYTSNNGAELSGGKAEKTDTPAAILPKNSYLDRMYVIISRKGEIAYA